jgi:dephospho-CoA kinase
MIIAGLTGGIASGKSTVAGYFAEAGARIIDADTIAREVVKPGSLACEEIRTAFGADVFLPAGGIDRQRLGDLVFNDPAKKKRLEAIVHPRVFDRMEVLAAETARQYPDALIILDIPLLLETKRNRRLDAVIVVYVPEAVQLERLMKRDGISAKAARARIRSQMPMEEKRRIADLVIDNSGDRQACRKQTLAIFRQLNQRAESA